MGVKTKTGKAPHGNNLRAAILAQIDDLLNVHTEPFLECVDESEDKKAVINFSCTVDLSESEPALDVRTRYSQTVTDKRSCVLDDPDQGTFRPVVNEAEEATLELKNTKSKKGKKDGAETPETT